MALASYPGALNRGKLFPYLMHLGTRLPWHKKYMGFKKFFALHSVDIKEPWPANVHNNQTVAPRKFGAIRYNRTGYTV